MKKYKCSNIAGQQFNSWYVIKEAPQRPPRTRYWFCRCVCGKEREVSQHQLTSGKSKSCGCSHSGNHKTHDMCQTITYRSWQYMRNRCNNPHTTQYRFYGGRGIRVCQRWNKFENFLTDMGIRPTKEYSIERKNNDGNYEPNNCHWVNQIEQANNKRSNNIITFQGKTQTVTQWGRELGIKPKNIFQRLYCGATPEQALNTKLNVKIVHNIIP